MKLLSLFFLFTGAFRSKFHIPHPFILRSDSALKSWRDQFYGKIEFMGFGDDERGDEKNLSFLGKSGNKLLIELSMNNDYYGAKKIIEQVRKEYGQAKLKELLLDARSDISGHTALLEASYFGRDAIVKLLIQEGADIHATDNNGQNALHLSCCARRVQLIGFLVNEGIDIFATDNSGSTALHLAVNSGDLQVVQDLVDKVQSIYPQDIERFCGQLDISGRTAAKIADEKKYGYIFKFLDDVIDYIAFDEGLEIAKQLESMKEYFVFGEELENISGEDVELLIQLIEGRHQEFGSIGFKKFVKGLYANNIMPLHIVSEYGDIEFFKVLMQVVTDAYNYETISCDEFSLLAFINSKDRYGRTALSKLMSNAFSMNVDSPLIIIADLLVKYGAYLDDELNGNIYGSSVGAIIPIGKRELKIMDLIDRAKKNKKFDFSLLNNYYVSLTKMIEEFVKKNSCEGELIIPYLLGGPEVIIRVKNRKGDTALHTMSGWGFADGVKKLTSLTWNFFKGDKKAYDNFINAKNAEGSTALFLCQDRETFKTLIYAGVDVSVRNKNNSTALNIAARSQYQENVEMIVEKLQEVYKDHKGEYKKMVRSADSSGPILLNPKPFANIRNIKILMIADPNFYDKFENVEKCQKSPYLSSLIAKYWPKISSMTDTSNYTYSNEESEYYQWEDSMYEEQFNSLSNIFSKEVWNEPGD
jgi:ankyrin repeat protein